ncbi:HAD-like protein [Panus rudis PR-1116 ss-1]|nr:HAD-like protein [Panus rudis PR-1116 ss-1]
MSSITFSKYKALLFDVYGTLIDWEEAIYQNLKPMLERYHSPLAKSKRETLTAFRGVETDLQARYPTMLYSDILARVHAELASRVKGDPTHPETVPASTTSVTSGGSDNTTTPVGTSASPRGDPDEAEHVAFGKSIPSWKPFPDTIPALAYLSTKFKLSVLSNVDKESFSATRKVLETSDPNHQFTFDGIYTAQDIGSYKPAIANFEYALKKLKDEFGVKKDEVLVVACSLPHDHVPSNKLGLTSVYIDRGSVSGLNENVDARYDAKYESLGAFAAAVEKEFAT